MKDFMYILIAAGFWGSGAFFSKLGVDSVGPWKVALIRSVTFFLVVSIFFLWRRESNWKNAFKFKKSNFFSIIAGILTGGAIILYLLSLKFFEISLVSPMIRLNLLITVILSVIFLDEKLTNKKIIGIILAMGALFLFSS